MPNVGPMEIVLLLGLALLLFGAKRLPEIGRSIGHGMREFKDSVSGNNLDEESRHELERVAASSVDETVVLGVPARDHDTV